jgi:anti-sigma regulatory factor (Ser/Thr protein kinase)
MRMSRASLPQLLRAYLFFGTLLLVGAASIYTTSLINRLNRQSRTLSYLFARFSAVATLTAIDNPEVRQIFEDVVKPGIDFPLVLTDEEGDPRVWKLPVTLDTTETGRLREIVQRFDRHNQPIPIRRPGDGRVFGYVHYGEPKLVQELRWAPVVQVAAVFLFIILGYLGYRNIKTSEQRAIWIGLAKETAHQLGTPISSLLGWVELLRERQLESGRGAGVIELPESFLRETLDEMENDAERLQKVANRFGQVGSLPRLEIQDVAPIVSEAVRYFRRRIPHLGRDVEIRERYELVPPVSVNKELIEWVVENILKNAVDATDRHRGLIHVDVARRRETESVEVRITDQGKGMTPAEMKLAFDPGYTTKQRGWGLGLTLAKRIVEEYHGGRIWVERSTPGAGSIVIISFPA